MNAGATDKMKKLIYVSFVDFSDSRFLGVIKKINNQLVVFSDAGFDPVLVTRFGSGVAVSKNGERSIIESDLGSFSRKVLCAAAAAEAQNGAVCSYVRFQFFCPSMLRMLRSMKKSGLYNVIEIPTYPYDNELRMQGLRGVPKYICDKAFRKSCTKYVDRYTTYCNDSEIYGVPAIALQNGVDTSALEVSKSDIGAKTLELITMSSMLPWHGVDRMINGLSEYYLNGGKRDVRLHILGDGALRADYEALCARLGLSSRVTFYGTLTGEQLDGVFDKAAVGICTLGAHLKNNFVGSPLKTVEYIARGLPVASELTLEFLPGDTGYLFNVPRDDSPLDIAGLSDFCDGLLKNRTSEELHNEIRRYAEIHCDIRSTMSKVTSWLDSATAERGGSAEAKEI